MDKGEKARFELEERVILFEGALRHRNAAMCEMEAYSNHNFDMYQQYVSAEVEYMRESLASTARIMSEQSEALAGAHLMDDGSTMRIMELGRRNELAEDGARHIIQESEIARQRYHSELENAVRHIQEQHHNAEETAEKFRQQRERLQQECHEYVAEKEEMNRQEMASITSRLAANAEMVMVNNENLQANAQNAVMIKDQELVHMQGQIPESTENMRQKDLTIEDLKQKLRDQIAYAGKLKTLTVRA